jgi:hypothetical protein
MKKSFNRVFATIVILTISSVSFADNVNATPSLSSRSGFIISGVVSLGIFLVVVLSSGPNKKDENKHED